MNAVDISIKEIIRASTGRFFVSEMYPSDFHALDLGSILSLSCALSISFFSPPEFYTLLSSPF